MALETVAWSYLTYTSYCNVTSTTSNSTQYSVCTGIVLDPYPDLLPGVFCLMVRIFRLMLVSLCI